MQPSQAGDVRRWGRKTGVPGLLECARCDGNGVERCTGHLEEGFQARGRWVRYVRPERSFCVGSHICTQCNGEGRRWAKVK